MQGLGFSVLCSGFRGFGVLGGLEFLSSALKYAGLMTFAVCCRACTGGYRFRGSVLITA